MLRVPVTRSLLACLLLSIGCSTDTTHESVVDAGSPGTDTPGSLDGALESVVAEPKDEASFVFDQTQLRTYNLVIDPAELAKLDANPAAEEYVQGALELDGKRYGPLGVRYKGSLGAFLVPCTANTQPGSTSGKKTGKCSLKIDFNRVDDSARFYGLKTLNFHSMGLDPSQLRDRLGYAMFREMGIPAPRAVHARVLINGVLEGLFVVVEQIDGHFTKGRFAEEGGQGNLYKEVWPNVDTAASYQNALETNEDVGAVDKMLAFKRAIDALPQQPGAIDGWLDRDYMARYLAVDRVIINDDGALHWYCVAAGIGNHNYYWYEASRDNRLWLVPWDLDSSFSGSSYVHIAPMWSEKADCSCTGSPAQRPATCDPLIAQWASWPLDYQTALAEFVTGPFAAANVDAKLDAWVAQIKDASAEASGLKGAPPTFLWQLSVSTLRGTIHEAREDYGYDYAR